MTSRFEQILEANSADRPQRWQSFAKRGDPIYGADRLMWGALAYGYKTAADIVAREYCNGRGLRDTLHAPIFFLYRHYIELQLKRIWMEYFSLGRLDSGPPDNEHGLLTLWRTIRETSQTIGLFSPDDEFLARVERSISHFNTLDARSTHSRYPTVGGKYHSFHIDIEGLIRAADDIDTVFFGLGAMLQECEVASG